MTLRDEGDHLSPGLRPSTIKHLIKCNRKEKATLTFVFTHKDRRITQNNT